MTPFLIARPTSTKTGNSVPSLLPGSNSAVNLRIAGLLPVGLSLPASSFPGRAPGYNDGDLDTNGRRVREAASSYNVREM